MARKVCIDEDTCIGCGTCEGICPEVFQLNEEKGKSEVIKPEGPRWKPSIGKNETYRTSRGTKKRRAVEILKLRPTTQ